MLLKQFVMEEEESIAKHKIEKLQRDRNTGSISDEQYEEQYETVMDGVRIKFAQLMEGKSWQAWREYHDYPESGFGF